MKKVKITWSKALTLLVSVLLFSLMLQGNAAVNTSKNWLFHVTNWFLVVGLFFSVLSILLKDEQE